MSQADELMYQLRHRDLSGHRLGTVTVNTFDEAMEIVESADEHFDVDDRDVVGIIENHSQNFRYDIIIDPSAGPDAFIDKHSYIDIVRVADE
jgi:hypothetical protein